MLIKAMAKHMVRLDASHGATKGRLYVFKRKAGTPACAMLHSSISKPCRAGPKLFLERGGSAVLQPALRRNKWQLYLCAMEFLQPARTGSAWRQAIE